MLHIRAPKPPAVLGKHGCLRATGLIAISNRVGDNLARTGVDKSRINVIYDAVDLSGFTPAAACNVLRVQSGTLEWTNL